MDNTPNMPCAVSIHLISFCIFIIGFDAGLTSGIMIYGISCIMNAMMPIMDMPK